MTTDASKLVLPIGIVVTVVGSAWYLRGAMATEMEVLRSERITAFTVMSENHVALRHEVEKLRLEVTRELRDLTRSVDSGVSTFQAESWIKLFRANLQAVDPKLVPAVPDLPKR